jgi:O-antigen ligase
MPPKLALLIAAIFVYYAFRSDKKRDVGNTTDLFWPSLWYMVVASRPVGIWLSLWNIPLPGGGSDDPTEGSSIDRYFFVALTIFGLRVLSRRRFKWGAVFARNRALVALIVYMAISICWSHYPFVSFKRYIKVFGSIVMAMVVLSSERPNDALCTVLRRCLYVHLPMSILCTRYFRDIGVTFEFDGGVEFWCGIATSKNTLGQVALLGVVYFFWEVRRHWAEEKWKNLHLLYLLMALYLLKGSDAAVSLTSCSVCIFAFLIQLRIQSLRSRPEAVRPFVMGVFTVTVSLVVFVLIHSVANFSANSVFGSVITMLGRDITLTGRTDIWKDVYAAASKNPLLGMGFGGFWIGRMANIPWNEHMTWVLGQAHNGYVDLFLQLGWIGCGLFAAVIFTALRPMFDSLSDDFDFGSFRITFFLTILFVDITESIFLRGDHHLWLVFMMVLWNVPFRPIRPVEAPTESASVEDDSPLLFTVPSGPGQATRHLS